MSHRRPNKKPVRVESKINCNLNFQEYLKDRNLGNPNKIGFNDSLNFKLFGSIRHVEFEKVTEPTTERGGIFNLEFSLDGRLLLAACEKKQVLLFDSINQKLINTIEYAHTKCVNCLRFLDDKTFATCSDDTLIKLWDIRSLKTAQRTLYGHSNWVKNIEYSVKENVMVTSAFDGSIYAWNLKGPTENNLPYDKVFLMNGLMRTKLSPDGSKMIISTTNGYMIIVHDLNLITLATDLGSFRPNLYRLMQISDQNFPIGSVFNFLFHPSRQRNRIEFIDDFPNDAEVISSLQVHPHGWSALTRNLSIEENEEWTSVHDIQKRKPEDYENAFSYIEEDLGQNSEEENTNQRPTDLWMGFLSVEESVQNRERESYIFSWMNSHSISSGLIGRHPSDAYFQQYPENRNKIIRNLPRLTHFVKEKNVGKGFIKELCFSSDGRIICSPYDKGIRLLGFNDKFQELSHCVPERPQQLTTLLEMNNYHSDVVVSCKFNPVFLQLVSGCLGSDIKWYQPKL